VENFSAGVADRLGIGYAAACEQRCDIVYCAISGYGQDGPMSRRPAYDHVVQAASGITMLTGTPETVPNRIGPPMFDYLAGTYGAFAVMAALRERDRTGQSQMVDVAMLDAAIVAMASTVSSLNNGGIHPKANGNTAASGSPASGIFETRKGLLSLAANQEAQLIRLCGVLKVDTLLQDQRFCSHESRLSNIREFREALANAFRLRSASEWEELLSSAHIPAARVRTLAETMAEPHIAKRGLSQQVIDTLTGQTISVPSIGFKWNQGCIGPRTAPPRLGQHTDEVLGSLGLSTTEISALRDAQIV